MLLNGKDARGRSQRAREWQRQRDAEGKKRCQRQREISTAKKDTSGKERKEQKFLENVWKFLRCQIIRMTESHRDRQSEGLRDCLRV